MAEAIFNQLAPRGTGAISAGSKPASEVNLLALAVLREIGIETSGLRPKLLTRNMAQQADKIVTMGCPEACPAVGKPMEDWGIEDPSGADVEAYRTAREIIRSKVERLVEALQWNQTRNAPGEGSTKRREGNHSVSIRRTTPQARVSRSECSMLRAGASGSG
jgi:protein-tyrosine-phosphatase